MTEFSFSFTHVPPVAKRDRHVLAALFSPDKRSLLLSRKHIYPQGIYRLFGGGIEAGETPLQAAKREILEETGVTLSLEDTHDLGRFEFHLLEEASSRSYLFTVHLFGYVLPTASGIQPADDVNEYRSFSQDQLASLIQNYLTLSPNLVTHTRGGSFRWSDYGKIFAPIHQAVLDYWVANVS